jgi:hypothetical protein
LGDKKWVRNNQFGDNRHGLEIKKRVAISGHKIFNQKVRIRNWLAITDYTILISGRKQKTD